MTENSPINDEDGRARRCKAIELLVLDVDGVMTDGGVEIDEKGGERKRFNIKDGAGVAFWKSQGKRAAILSGRSAAAVNFRAEELGIEPVLQGVKDKGPALVELAFKLGFSLEQVAYIGDDLPDLPAMAAAGFSACPADAASEVKARAHFVSQAEGGKGAVRETIEHILKIQNSWSRVLSRFHISN